MIGIMNTVSSQLVMRTDRGLAMKRNDVPLLCTLSYQDMLASGLVTRLDCVGMVSQTRRYLNHDESDVQQRNLERLFSERAQAMGAHYVFDVEFQYAYCPDFLQCTMVGNGYAVQQFDL